MTDIAEIFARDPLSLTKSGPEIKAVIEYFRAARARYDLGEKSAGSPKKIKEPKAPKGAAPTPSLADLDL